MTPLSDKAKPILVKIPLEPLCNALGVKLGFDEGERIKKILKEKSPNESHLTIFLQGKRVLIQYEDEL